MAVRPRWLLPAPFVLLGLTRGSSPAALRTLTGEVVGLRYDAGVSRAPSGVHE